VVSTRCPSGPEEILEAGRFGRLVEPGDPGELAEAITAEIENPTPAELLRDRARDFGAHRSVSAYLDLLFPEGRTRERHAPIPEGAS
jgi:glycosyltransferase involved in cell wall biosynthesis